MLRIRAVFAHRFARACLLALLVLGFGVRPVISHLGGLHGLEHVAQDAHGHAHEGGSGHGHADDHDGPRHGDPAHAGIQHGDGHFEHAPGSHVHHAGHHHDPRHESGDGTPKGNHLLLHVFDCVTAMEMPLTQLELPAHALAVPLPPHAWATAPEQSLSSPFRPPISA